MTVKSSNIQSAEHLKRAFKASIKLASNFIGATYPNPAVGCSLLDATGDILGIGCHEKAGEIHAECDALNVVESKGHTSLIDTAVVTLEPCSHHGKTPPCTDALLAAHLKKVVIGITDPTEKAGGGAKKLRENGVSVTFLEGSKADTSLSVDSACLALPFLSYAVRRRPWIIVKQALNDRGDMIPPKGQKTFSSEDSLRVAHLLRRSADTILTTTKTIEADNPLFTVREVATYNPDVEKKIIVMGRSKVSEAWTKAREKDGFKVYFVPTLKELDTVFLEAQSQMVLVEAGPTFLASLRKEKLWDEWLEISCKETEELRSRVSETGLSFFEDDLGIPFGSFLGFLKQYSSAWPRNLALLES